MLSIHDLIYRLLGNDPQAEQLLNSREVRWETLAYMLYWHHRLESKPTEQQHIMTAMISYADNISAELLAGLCVADVYTAATKYVETEMIPARTIDLVCNRGDDILCIQRDFYPRGISLVGGFINDEDDVNVLGVSGELFAALRVAAEKILLASDPVFSLQKDEFGNDIYSVTNTGGTCTVKIYPHNRYGYRFRDKLRSILRPSDTRHIVDTIGYKCYIEGDLNNSKLLWKNRHVVVDEFVFEHHREVLAHVYAQSSVEAELLFQEKDFIRNIINNPLESYRDIQSKFNGASDIQASFPEMFPVVDRLIREMYSDAMNGLCADNNLFIAIRDKATISLRHVALKNRIFCPYSATLRAIGEAVAFFDIVARFKRDFYKDQPTGCIIEHNPREVKNASYHMYRYKYRLDSMLAMVPGQIIIPTFEYLSATDLMRVRGVPIRFIGLSTDFIYVDEFEQSPEEFYMHDCNHSYRMIQEDEKIMSQQGFEKDAFYKNQTEFALDYLKCIKIQKTDTEFQKEIKKIKKIILFEIVHEDARPFLKETICEYIQQVEGGAVPFEVPRIDPKTGYMDMVDTLDTGISTLSYVRNKLQHGFYDQVDAQLPQIVGPAYRKSKFIAMAAYEMLVELEAVPVSGAEIDVQGRVSYEWLLRRTCSVGPDNIHDAAEIDEALLEFGDGIALLNPKRYQA